jgi:hypothetical protein
VLVTLTRGFGQSALSVVSLSKSRLGRGAIERWTLALVMIGTYARRLRAPDYPHGPTAEQH